MKILSFIFAFLILGVNIFSFSVSATNIYKSVPNAEKMIALTFDDGPHPRYTEKILDSLKKHGVKATFFVIGENIEYYDEGIVERMISEGHEIGNHTFSHNHVKLMSEKEFFDDVRSCHELLKEKYSYEIKLFRPPEGYVDQKVETVADELNYSIVLWSVDTKDWEHVASSTIVGNVEKNASNGGIILMHDYVSQRSTTLDALEEIIPRLKREGYKFVTVSELIK